MVAGVRADAARNRDLLLRAARDVFVEHGSDVALDEVARRAGVGIATLYRRFPDRSVLIRAVVLDVLAEIAASARLALAEEADPGRALARYMHAALDIRVAAVMPAIVGTLLPLDDAEVIAAREASVAPLAEIIARAQSAGVLRPDVTFGDIGLLLIRLSRPLPQSLPSETEHALAHRHLDIVLAGLLSAERPLSGPALSLADLQQP